MEKENQLISQGKERTLWAQSQMGVLARIRSRFNEEKPFKEKKIGACLHISAKTANLVLAIKEGGANVALSASNPLSTQDDIASYLQSQGIAVFARRKESSEEYRENLLRVLNFQPDFIIDDGADLTVLANDMKVEGIKGSTEETTTGIRRISNLARAGKLRFPAIAVNSALSKHLFDNRYGTGQSALDGIIRATNLLIAGSRAVVCGYGWVGKGVARRLQGMGARVIVTEVSPIAALEALMDGFEVMPIYKAASLGDLFVTCTGDIQVIEESSLKLMKDGAILANAGHFNVEIDIHALKKISQSRRRISDSIEEFTLDDGRRLYLLGEGRLVNLVCGEGHPAWVMDLSFSDQALALEYLTKNRDLPPALYPLPKELDEMVATLKLNTMQVEIDSLTSQQKEYLDAYSWE